VSKPVQVVIAIPNEGHTPVESYANRLEGFFHLGKLQERTKEFQFHFVTLGRIFTPLAREEAAKLTEELNADYLYMIDDDMICPVDMFERLYAHNVDMVAPLAFTRNFPHHPVIYDVIEDWDPISNSHYAINHFVDNYPKDTMVECDAVGFGAVLIKRKVLQGVPPPRFMSTCGTGEDVYFCHQARKAGFQVFMDTSLKLGHLSHPIEVTEEYREQVRKKFKYREKLPLSSKYNLDRLKKGEALVIQGG